MKTWGLVIGGWIAAILAFIGIVVPFLFPFIMNFMLDQRFILKPDDKIHPITFYRQVYFFNVTNSKDILKGKKPYLKEIGPFTYKEVKTIYYKHWNEPLGTVTFQENSTFFFQPHLSGSLTEDTLITTINPILLTLASLAEDPKLPEAAHAVLEMYMWRFQMSPFITKPAGELMFHGYREDVLRALSSFTRSEVHATGKFGFFYPHNNTSDGDLKVNTGSININELFDLIEWEGKSTMDVWKTDSCNKVGGKMGSPVARPIIKDNYLYLFSTGLCRPIYFSYEKDVYFRDLQLYRYIIPYTFLARTPENDCFCCDDFTCRAAMACLAPCKNGAPLVFSYPHFYMASSEDISSIGGLHPIQEHHNSNFDIEPNTGLILRVNKRAQLNMPLKRYASLPVLKNVPEVIFPVLWMNESVEVSMEITDLIYSEVILPNIILNYTCLGLLVLGLVIALTCVYFWCKENCRKRRKDNKEWEGDMKFKELAATRKPFISGKTR